MALKRRKVRLNVWSRKESVLLCANNMKGYGLKWGKCHPHGLHMRFLAAPPSKMANFTT